MPEWQCEDGTLMDLVFYHATKSRSKEVLLKELESVVPGGQIAVCRSLEELAQNLMRPFYNLLAVVLVVADLRDLTGLLTLRSLICDARVIVILPDHKNGTLNKGHRLRPRFLTFADADPADVAAVVRKMLRNCGLQLSGNRSAL
jgi:hypothetical protein